MYVIIFWEIIMRVMDLGNCTIVCSLCVNANYFFEVKSDDVRDSTVSEMSYIKIGF